MNSDYSDYDDELEDAFGETGAVGLTRLGGGAVVWLRYLLLPVWLSDNGPGGDSEDEVLAYAEIDR